MGNFEKLKVWQKAKDLAVYIYKVTNNDKFAKDWELKGQLRKSGVSMPSNISEGDESGSNRSSIKYFRIAKGSSAEARTQAIIAFEIKYLTKNDYTNHKIYINLKKRKKCNLLI